MRIALSAAATLCTLLACCAEHGREAASSNAAPAQSRVPTTPRSCSVEAGTPMTGSGIGDLTVGALPATIKQRCLVLADTTQEGNEGDSERILVVRLGSDTVAATVVEDEVWRIEVNTPRFRTADSLGVGSRVAAFRRFRDLKAMSGEGPYYLVTASHCGMSFGLPVDAVPDTLYVQTLEGPGLSVLSDSLKVQSVLIVGCHAR